MTWLTAYYANDDLPTDPVELFAIVAEVPELWENGQIDDARGIPAIARFLSSLVEFDQRSWPPLGSGPIKPKTDEWR
ncbi:hypothetical protein [Roseovarius gaetbuli]|uniref:hypothetical protein n=1 Tax=Roseovarius gaetbuli TaxID=1356575 RepID=UPI00111C53BB|nr:hypothetical protein [Roseovarius gaetbuli]